MRNTFLFSVDLEDVRSLVPGGERYEERVPENTERLLSFLVEHDTRCTFFTTGDVARRYPELLAQIARAGHEIACHTSDHVPLDRQTPESLRADVLRCQEDYERAGVPRAVGFRAPSGSLVASTAWAYDVLGELGFEYSASVLAARNPLYGWPDFGPDQPCLRGKLVEIPASLSHLPGLNVPFMSGVYLRVLPFPLVRLLFRRRLRGRTPVASYLHPFDVDSGDERFPFPGLNPFFGTLMYRNRDRVFDRLHSIFAEGARVETYREYARRFRGARA
ncbi:MAG TPA: polysaccharide deacetylase family protein [Polyangiaceae bacterium]|nr:polysaccharide deacetylase family protein [Polyangiaceae bacterium]